ncbi:MAG TPA: hypothetical protein VKZ92_02275, partial [Pseudohongiella sp.]|nr:hypothetical protein [Pseudohongiella sp.]
MKSRNLNTLKFKSLALAVTLFAAASPALQAQGQNSFRLNYVYEIDQGEWNGPRLSDGQPDVRGHWSNTIGNHNYITDPQGRFPLDPPRENERPRESRAPSRLVLPVDGEFPFHPWARAKQQEFLNNLYSATRPEYVEPLARCAPGGPTKSFMWHGYEIRQYPGYVLFLFDSGTRLIHLD